MQVRFFKVMVASGIFASLAYTACAGQWWDSKRDAAAMVRGEEADYCDCPRTPRPSPRASETATPTPVPRPTALPSALPTFTLAPTPVPTLAPTPHVELKAVLDLGFDATWEDPHTLLVMLADKVTQFDTDKDTLKPEGLKRLQKLGEVLGQFGENTLRVDGHTDSIGSHKYNQDLSQRRAKRVEHTLEGMGIAASRFTSVKGWAYDKPIGDNHSVEGRAKNRRVEIRLTFKGYRWDPASKSLVPEPKAESSPTQLKP